jgi:hypothetical protein
VSEKKKTVQEARGPEPPALPHARRLYQAEIGSVTPLVDRELRRLVERYPDPAEWDEAFLEAMRANVPRLRYVVQVLAARKDRAAGIMRRGANERERGSATRRGAAPDRRRSERYDDESLRAAQERAAAVEPIDLDALLGKRRG